MPDTSAAPATLDDIRLRLAHNLRRMRRAIQLSQERLALESGVDRTMLSKIERRLSNPSLETLLKLANRLGADVSALLAPHDAAVDAPSAEGLNQGQYTATRGRPVQRVTLHEGESAQRADPREGE